MEPLLRTSRTLFASARCVRFCEECALHVSFPFNPLYRCTPKKPFSPRPFCARPPAPPARGAGPISSPPARHVPRLRRRPLGPARRPRRPFAARPQSRPRPQSRRASGGGCNRSPRPWRRPGRARPRGPREHLRPVIGLLALWAGAPWGRRAAAARTPGFGNNALPTEMASVFYLFQAFPAPPCLTRPRALLRPPPPVCDLVWVSARGSRAHELVGEGLRTISATSGPPAR